MIPMIRKMRAFNLACLSVLALASTLLAFQSTPKPQEPTAQIAARAAQAVGNVQETWVGGNKGLVFVFEEFHTSRVGRLQTAVMLLRLRDGNHMKKIGLEGAIQAVKPIDGSWFHKAGGTQAASTREDVAVRMLAEGEINSGEFMALISPELELHGTELAEEYDYELKVKGNPPVTYLIDIAEKSLSQSDIRKVNELASAKKNAEALELILKADPWVQEQYKATQADGATPAEDSLERARVIQAKARALSVTVDAATQADMGKMITFYEMTSRRSATMVKRVAELAAQNPGVPTAMIIGAAHTRGVTKLLKERNLSYAVLTPIALNPKYGQLTFEQFEQKNARKWAHTAQGTLGKMLNPLRNPPPVIETATAKSYASANLAAMLVAQALRKGKKVPDDLRGELTGLPECRIDLASFGFDGYDVIFQMSLKRTDGTETTVWARAGTAAPGQTSKTLEEKLMQAIADMGGNSNLPPTPPPTNSTLAKEEGPGDGKRNTVVISRTSLDTLVVFGTTKANVVAVGKISG